MTGNRDIGQDSGAAGSGGAANPKTVLLYLDNNSRLVASPYRGAVESRALVCSIPKAGTYLLTEILAAMGFVHVPLHIAREEFSDYRFGTREEHRRHPERFRVVLGCQHSLALVAPGQVVVGHLPHEEEVIRACAAFRVCFLYRDLRDCAISLMRFLAETGRYGQEDSYWMSLPDGPQRLIRFLQPENTHWDWLVSTAANQIGWLASPLVIPVQFESLLGDLGAANQCQTLERMSRHLNVGLGAFPNPSLLGGVLNRETLTWSGRRTQREEYWSDEAQRLFVDSRACQLNQRLGYC